MAPDEPAGPIVRVNVVLTFEDYQVFAVNMRSKWTTSLAWLWGILLYGALMGLAILAARAEVIYDVPSFGGWGCFGCCLLVAAGFLINTYFTRFDRKRWQAAEELRIPHTFVFSPTSIQIISAKSTFNTTWKYIIGVQSVDSLILLTNQHGTIHILPVRAFASPEDHRTFQQFVEALVQTGRK